MGRFVRSRRRSRSDRPPQTPSFSPVAMANSRHSSRTGQPWHTARAGRVDAPRPGKKRSGSSPTQLPSAIHAGRPMASAMAS